MMPDVPSAAREQVLGGQPADRGVVDAYRRQVWSAGHAAHEHHWTGSVDAACRETSLGCRQLREWPR